MISARPRYSWSLAVVFSGWAPRKRYGNDPGALAVVSRSSEESLLPRLDTWKRAENLVGRIGLAIEPHAKSAFYSGLLFLVACCPEELQVMWSHFLNHWCWLHGLRA
jgi:hypothetical protein